MLNSNAAPTFMSRRLNQEVRICISSKSLYGFQPANSMS